jgi:hypothetical protein
MRKAGNQPGLSTTQIRRDHANVAPQDPSDAEPQRVPEDMATTKKKSAKGTSRKTSAKKTSGKKPARKTRKSSSKRELIAPRGDKRYIRRNAKGRIKESDDVSRSLSGDRRRKAKTEAGKGQGDRGD